MRNIVTATVYNARDVIATVDAAGNRTSFSYDNDGWRTDVQTPLNFRSTTVNDDVGQLSALVDPANARTTYQYDAAGNQTTLIDANGKISSTTNRTTAIAYPPPWMTTARALPSSGTAHAANGDPEQTRQPAR